MHWSISDMSLLLIAVMILGMLGLGYAGMILMLHITPSDVKDLFMMQYDYWRERMREKGW